MAEKTTRNLRDLAANLRHIANLFESADVGELASPASLYVSVSVSNIMSPAGADLVDQLVAVTGVPASFEDRGYSTGRAWYGTTLEQETWRFGCSTLATRPDPAEQLRIENEQLRAALGKIKKIASKHTEVDGCTCEDCEDLAGCDG